jgi:nucleoside-diphosphate-sugar epimerase
MGNELAKELIKGRNRVRLVARNPREVPGAETMTADISDLGQTVSAVSGSTVVYLMVGLKYDLAVWRQLWPRLMGNTIEACKRVKAKLIFFDNVYVYGKVNGVMTEETPFNPCSKKGEVRAQIAMALLKEIKAGDLTALIARSADFYGSGAKASIPNVMAFDKLAMDRPASWPVNDSVPHSFTFTPDAARSLVLLAESEDAWNQTWHVATASNPLTGEEFICMAARELGARPQYRVLSRPIIKIAGWFDKTTAEMYEMLYQYDRDYLFDATKFAKAFHFQPTPYGDAIRVIAEKYRDELARGTGHYRQEWA